MLKWNWNEEHARKTPKAEWVKAHLHAGDKGFLEAEHDRLNGKDSQSEIERPKEEVKAKAKSPAKKSN